MQKSKFNQKQLWLKAKLLSKQWSVSFFFWTFISFFVSCYHVAKNEGFFFAKKIGVQFMCVHAQGTRTREKIFSFWWKIEIQNLSLNLMLNWIKLFFEPIIIFQRHGFQKKSILTFAGHQLRTNEILLP